MGSVLTHSLKKDWKKSTITSQLIGDNLASTHTTQQLMITKALISRPAFLMRAMSQQMSLKTTLRNCFRILQQWKSISTQICKLLEPHTVHVIHLKFYNNINQNISLTSLLFIFHGTWPESSVLYLYWLWFCVRTLWGEKMKEPTTILLRNCSTDEK